MDFWCFDRPINRDGWRQRFRVSRIVGEGSLAWLRVGELYFWEMFNTMNSILDFFSLRGDAWTTRCRVPLSYITLG